MKNNNVKTKNNNTKNNNEKLFTKDMLKKPSTWVLVACLVACLTMFVFGLVKLCMFSSGSGDAKYINIIQMIFALACILIFAICFLCVKYTKLKISQPFAIYLELVILTFFGIYPCFSLFANAIALGFFFGLLGLTLAAISLSVYYAFSRSQNGQVRANPWFVMIVMYGFAVVLVVLFEVLVYLVTKSNTQIISNFVDFVSQLGYAACGITLCAVVSLISLFKGKIFVNLCLMRKISD